MNFMQRAEHPCCVACGWRMDILEVNRRLMDLIRRLYSILRIGQALLRLGFMGYQTGY
jgi:hypothetical protein